MTFEDYLIECREHGIIDHHLRMNTEGLLPHIYIHPANRSGRTLDFEVQGDELWLMNTSNTGPAEEVYK